MNVQVPGTPGVWLSEDSCSIEDFEKLLDDRSGWAGAPNAVTIEQGIPIYDAVEIGKLVDDSAAIAALMSEWASTLLDGPG
ncbi:MAG: hypothetical protein GY798_15140, partial [Hyphomicrobiales bacterium]|nr:hypothetical protein [Hyphomicrobiales bacterium]